ncbi:MAG TPA: CRISPR-associated protein Cas4 [Terriglobia bacterium]|nr:CRISPR-associated protein Cas4 [Terriglobia bacterium]
MDAAGFLFPLPMPYPLRVNDLKQWEYCPRIVFYNTVMPVARKSTIKMERGKQVEVKLDALETRRTLRRYRLAEGERQFNVSLSSERLGLSGRLDLLITTPEACYPVDFKYTRDRPRRNHVMQLAGYALLLEDAMERPAPAGFIYITPSNQVLRINVTEGLKDLVRKRLAEIRSMIREAILPEPTPVRARCEECEFRNYCGDIF